MFCFEICSIFPQVAREGPLEKVTLSKLLKEVRKPSV